MYCYKCGKEIDEGVKFCPYCGTQISGQDMNYGSYEPIHQQSDIKEEDAPSGGFAFISFLVPLVGIVLYVIWHKEYPLKAKSCLKGIVAGFVLEIIMFCCVASTIGNIFFENRDDIEYYTSMNTVVEEVAYESNY